MPLGTLPTRNRLTRGQIEPAFLLVNAHPGADDGLPSPSQNKSIFPLLHRGYSLFSLKLEPILAAQEAGQHAVQN